MNYSAVILTKESHEKLLRAFSTPKGWETYAHHMTIIYGKPLPEHCQGDIGKLVKLEVTHIGQNDTAQAAKVKGYYSTNKIPHVTLAVDKANGGKPVDSNKIERWEEVETFIIEGIIG